MEFIKYIKDSDWIMITVKRPVSFTTLAALFNISESLLRASNDYYDSEEIRQNETVHIPGFYLKSHEIMAHDTVSSLCEQYKTTENILKLINGENLLTNKTIFIPMKKTKLIVNDINNYSYEKMNEHIGQLLEVYPFIKQKIIGYSILNKPIVELLIGNGPYCTHFNGSFHGNEWITTAALMKSLNEYARLLTDSSYDQSLIDTFKKTTVSIVPMVNPDGVNLVLNGLDSAGKYRDDVFMMNEKNEDFSRWKANIVGVDLNKQFPALWEFEQQRKPTTPTFRDYPGIRPLTEPESIAMATLTNKSNFKRIHACHTQGEEIYWGFQQLERHLSKKIVTHYAHITQYKPIQVIDNYAGYKDWFIKQFRRPGFTIELGKGENPLPISQFDSIYNATFNIFMANLTLTI